MFDGWFFALAALLCLFVTLIGACWFYADRPDIEWSPERSGLHALGRLWR